MNYAPPHNDTKMRTIYAILVAAGLALYFVGTGWVKAVLTALSLVFLATGLYLFIKHDLTTYTYILMENEGRQDFYVDRVVGKRGTYVCYYPLCDAVCLEEYKKGTRHILEEKYGKVFVYNYCHNRFSGKKQVLVFENDGYYDAVIIELDEMSINVVKSYLSLYSENK